MGAFEDFWTFLYRDVFRENDFLFTIGGTSVVTGLLFYGLGGFLALLDLTGKPEWLHKYKVQPGTNEPVSRRKLLRALRLVNINLGLVSGPFLILIYPLQQYMGCSCKPEDLPTVLKFLKDLAFFVVFEEIGFYYTHRLAHWGPLYKYIHKTHHEWTAPVGIICVYAHPLEHILCNLVPFTMSGTLLGSHLVTRVTWALVGLFGTMIHHSGYHFPFVLSPEAHDFHHLKFNYNYGVLGILDWLHGTDKLFAVSPQYKRHQVLRGFRPMTSIFPDEKAKDKTN